MQAEDLVHFGDRAAVSRARSRHRVVPSGDPPGPAAVIPLWLASVGAVAPKQVPKVSCEDCHRHLRGRQTKHRQRLLRIWITQFALSPKSGSVLWTRTATAD